ncbi:hypothetical protein [Lentibacillus sp. Marseille-P4043]|uniref:hypothetical protein n=1 Tax=Lentibacillus sp. Marseille-P4043 TaxID=2040293 RepID=UPI000D0B3A22|nr:hypothetical protein [Lentibacillus sp. Marseille-P4043]
MSLFVTNCFQWIGFHIVNYLIEHDFKVDGFDEIETSKQENLSMLVGRNDLFSLVTPETVQKKAYDMLIINGSHESQSAVQADRTIHLCWGLPDKKLPSRTTIIKLPLLFGEWMPMNEKGMYAQNKFIPFDSADFLDNGVYIEDFINCLAQLIQTNHFPSFIEIKSANNKTRAEKELEKAIYPRDVSPIEENVKKVLEHYDRFHDLYES